MGKFLSILVPHYNEEFSVVKPLLDSIRVQQNINLDEIEVVICDDGPDAVDISAELMGYFDLDIKYYREEKGGVSKMRNLAFQHSTGEYVCWADCDDCFYHCLAFWFIKRETVTPMMVMLSILFSLRSQEILKQERLSSWIGHRVCNLSTVRCSEGISW